MRTRGPCDDAQREFARSLETLRFPREDVAAFQDVVQDLAFSGPNHRTTGFFKARLMARVAQEPQEAAEATGSPGVRSKGVAWNWWHRVCR